MVEVVLGVDSRSTSDVVNGRRTKDLLAGRTSGLRRAEFWMNGRIYGTEEMASSLSYEEAK